MSDIGDETRPAQDEGPKQQVRSDEVEGMIGRLGLAMLAAGYAVTDVASQLRKAAHAAGRPAMSVGALPNAVLVDDPAVQRARVADMAPGTAWGFDKSQRVGTIAADAAAGRAGPAEIVRRLDEVESMTERYPAWLMVIGFGLIAAGVSTVFRTSWEAVAVDFAAGLVVGVVLTGLGRFERLAGLLPVAMGFVSAALVFGLSDLLGLGPVPLYAVFAPIVVLVPGAAITNAVIELAAGDVVSGGGRLVGGLVTWLMLLLGILLGAGAVGVSPAEITVLVNGDIPAWAPAVGLIAMAVGIVLTNSAAVRMWVLVTVVLLATFAIVVGAGAVVGYQVASGVAAAVMLVATRLLERRFRELPAIVTFRPAFWFLVPGSLGLATLTEFTASGAPVAETFVVAVFGTVVAISLGVQVGAVISEAVTAG